MKMRARGNPCAPRNHPAAYREPRNHDLPLAVPLAAGGLIPYPTAHTMPTTTACNVPNYQTSSGQTGLGESQLGHRPQVPNDVPFRLIQGVRGVAHSPERRTGVRAGMFEQDLASSWMIRQEPRYINHLTIVSRISQNAGERQASV